MKSIEDVLGAEELVCDITDCVTARYKKLSILHVKIIILHL